MSKYILFPMFTNFLKKFPYSAISGYDVKLLKPQNPTKACAFKMSKDKRHIIFTAETHNFPTGTVLALLFFN